MYSIFRKELNTFFSSLIGYISIGVFLILIGLFMWVFTETNVLDRGYATMDTLFNNAPFVFLFLIPAITMRMFAEEKQTSTLELLLTKPITDLNIILGKYFAALFLVVVSIIPTLIYLYSVYQLGDPIGNIDLGAIAGSYLGLMFLAAAFVSIGIFASSISRNQIVSFVLAMVLCFAIYLLFDYTSKIPVFVGKIDFFIQQMGIDYHYQSMSQGVILFSDVVYFLSIISLFIFATRWVIARRN